ncbi:MAG: hypothetical protein SCH71_08475 [Desulfobulbaceae bacterium]|nr:hypothetical protein [Desulfobulbaceae bacterium]
MILSIEHDLLVSGPDIQTCSQHARRFLEKSQLVHYDTVEIDLEHSMNGSDARFPEALDRSIARNHEILAQLLAQLKEEGCVDLDHLLLLSQGFPSKLLHTMCHLLDGFFGVDSFFFDIDEVSNWLTAPRQKQIRESPETCWLMHVKAKSFYGGGFEKKTA